MSKSKKNAANSSTNGSVTVLDKPVDVDTTVTQADVVETDTTARHHGPYATREDATKAPVHYGPKSKSKGEVLPLFAVSMDVDALTALLARAEASANKCVTEWYYGMNSHHAAIAFLNGNGGEVSSRGNGSKDRSKVLAAANKRASEAEMMAAAAMQARLDVENQLESLKVQLAHLQSLKNGQ